jgi:hypothetical protein
MIARLVVVLPFRIAVPQGASFAVDGYEDEGYKVRVFQPCLVTLSHLSEVVPQTFKMDDQPAVLVNALHIEFRKDAFNRLRDGPLDPPEAVITRAVDSLLTRLGYVTQSDLAINWSVSTHQLKYLNDDGTEVPQDAELLSRTEGIGREFRVPLTLTEQIWHDVHSLPRDFAPPAWHDLLVDATLPSRAGTHAVGTAIVLAYTSLEVFIAEILNKLAAKTELPTDLWTWLNKRGGDLDKLPTTEEQFDTLLKHFTKHSLKAEDKTLWQACIDLRKARNSFVHEGSAKIAGKPVSPADAPKLVDSACEIISWVRNVLPEDLKWPEFEKRPVSRSVVFHADEFINQPL